MPLRRSDQQVSSALVWPQAVLPQKITSGIAPGMTSGTLCGIHPGEIHLWAWRLGFPRPDASPVPSLDLLDAAEIERYHRFHFERDRVRFAIAHLCLRKILGSYLGRAPEAIRFSANRYGKPGLAGEDSGRLFFNLSHSHDVALLAVSPDVEVGADIEEIRPIEAEVAEAHFSQHELDALQPLTGEQWLRGFYRCWTRKEAILKAEGVGLNPPLAAFDVSLTEDKPAQLVAVRPPVRFHHSWKLYSFEPSEETIAALAASAPAANISCFSLAPEF